MTAPWRFSHGRSLGISGVWEYTYSLPPQDFPKTRERPIDVNACFILQNLSTPVCLSGLSRWGRWVILDGKAVEESTAQPGAAIN
jgi:hypothetical protein